MKKNIYAEQRVGIFVDIQNLYYSAKHLYDKRVNFMAVLNEAVNNRKLIRAVADVGIAVDAIQMSPKLDVVVLISGDGDYIPLVEYLKGAQGCRVEVLAFGRSTSTKLKESVDEFIDLDKNKKYLIG